MARGNAATGGRWAVGLRAGLVTGACGIFVQLFYRVHLFWSLGSLPQAGLAYPHLPAPARIHRQVKRGHPGSIVTHRMVSPDVLSSTWAGG